MQFEKNRNVMTQDYSYGEDPTPMAGEPSVAFGVSEKKKLRVFSWEEIDRCMPLEESERLITEKIYRAFHPDA